MNDHIECIKCREFLGDDDTPNGLRLVWLNGEALCATCYRKSLTNRSHRRFLFQVLNYLSQPGKVEERVFNSMPSVTHYRGRFFYEGPAVSAPWPLIKELEGRLKRNGIPYQLDNMGLDGIIYAR